MNKPLKDRHQQAVIRFRRQVLTVLQQAHTEPDNGWMDTIEVAAKLGHGTPGEIRRAFEGLTEAGLAEKAGHKARSRGVTAARVYNPYPEGTEAALAEFRDRPRDEQVTIADDLWFVTTALSAIGYTPMHAVAELIKRGWQPPAAGSRA